jgi:hypothetical protein
MPSQLVLTVEVHLVECKTYLMIIILCGWENKPNMAFHVFAAVPGRATVLRRVSYRIFESSCPLRNYLPVPVAFERMGLVVHPIFR